MSETAAQKRKRLADQLAQLETEGNEGAGKLREQLDQLPEKPGPAPRHRASHYKSPVTPARDADK